MKRLLIVHHTPSPSVQGMFGAFLHGNNDATGALRALESITTGLKWKAVQPPVTVMGEPSRSDLEACWELGAVTAAELGGV